MFRLGHQCEEASLNEEKKTMGINKKRIVKCYQTLVGCWCVFLSLFWISLSEFAVEMRLRHASGVSSCALFQFLICSVRLDVLLIQCFFVSVDDNVSRECRMCAVESNVLSGLSDVGCREHDVNERPYVFRFCATKNLNSKKNEEKRKNQRVFFWTWNCCCCWC